MPARRGYRDEPAQTSAAGSVVVFMFGMILLLAALAGGFILSWKAGLVPLGNGPKTTVDAAQVCDDVKAQNADYLGKITAALAAGAPGASAAATAKPADLYAEWVTKLHGQAARTDNADLQAAINGFASTLEGSQSADAAALTGVVTEGERSMEPHCA